MAKFKPNLTQPYIESKLFDKFDIQRDPVLKSLHLRRKNPRVRKIRKRREVDIERQIISMERKQGKLGKISERFGKLELHKLAGLLAEDCTCTGDAWRLARVVAANCRPANDATARGLVGSARTHPRARGNPPAGSRNFLISPRAVHRRQTRAPLCNAPLFRATIARTKRVIRRPYSRAGVFANCPGF